MADSRIHKILCNGCNRWLARLEIPPILAESSVIIPCPRCKTGKGEISALELIETLQHELLNLRAEIAAVSRTPTVDEHPSKRILIAGAGGKDRRR